MKIVYIKLDMGKKFFIVKGYLSLYIVSKFINLSQIKAKIIYT